MLAEYPLVGFGLAINGDLDGDGTLEFADVDLLGDYNGLSGNGMAVIRSGRTGAVFFQRFGTTNGEGVGGVVKSLGDLDGDGVIDFVVGSDPDIPVGLIFGRLRIYSGATGLVIREHIDSRTKDIHNIGDVDQDGVSDYLIAYSFVAPSSGVVYSGQTGTVIRVHDGFGGLLVGEESRALGDVDADGVGDYCLSSGSGPGGQGYVYSGATGSEIHHFVGNGVGNSGGRVWATGDVDGDGHADLIRLSRHQYALTSGATGEEILGLAQQYPLTYDLGGSMIGITIPLPALPAGDLDGDGFDEFIYSHSTYGVDLFRSGRVRVLRGGFSDCGGVNYCPQQPNSSGNSATVRLLGQPEAARNNLTLVLEGGPNDEFAFFLASRGQDLVVNPGGYPGSLCLGGGQGIARLHRTMGITYEGSHWAQVDLASVPEPPFGQTMALSGEQWNFQGWFRDGTASHFSNAVTVVFQ